MSVQVWRYSEPNGKALEGWYVAFIDAVGFVSIQSDWGDYAYCWTARGEGVGIREFLLACDDSYVLGKFAPRRVLDEKATREAIAQALLDSPLDGFRLDDEQSLLADADLSNEVGVSDWLRESTLDGRYELIRSCPDPQAVAFMERVWPRLIAKVRAELVAEKERAA